MLKNKKGFALIELLVVIAIVGLMASIVLGYLGSARKKGDETAVKSNLGTIRSSSELFYVGNNNSYLPVGGANVTGTCPIAYNPSGTDMFSKDKAIYGAITEAIYRGVGSSCYNAGNFWAVAIGLKLVPNTSWCVDSGGAGKVVNSIPSAAINAGTFSCN